MLHRATTAVLLLAVSSRAAAAGAEVTFTKDIAPIMFAQCASCHRPGGSGPFSVLDFSDVRPRARTIAAAVQRRTMPPWMPEPGHGDFIGARRLTEDQITAIVRWADAGAPLGDPAAVPSPPESRDGWPLGRPDLIVEMPNPYRLPPGGPDRLRNFVIPIPQSTRRYVRAWTFHVTNQRVVHHATVMIDPTRASRRMDQADPEPGYEGLIPLSAKNPDGYFIGWTPGQGPSTTPDPMAWPLEGGSDLLLMVHLRPTDAWETVEVGLGLYFTDVPPTRTPTMIRLNRQDIDIPAGDPHHAATDSYVLPVDVDAYSVQPHAHNLAKEMKGWATLPDGTTKWLIDIRRWDFHWQDLYRFTIPIRLPAGTLLSMQYTYDNSAGNPTNLDRPPKRVTWGQKTSNEMGDLWLQVLPSDAADSAVLNHSLLAKLLPQNISGYESLLKADPDNTGLHDDLAILFAQAGDGRNAVAQFTESLRLRPDAPSRYNLGNALWRAGDRAEAEAQFVKALERNPDYALAHQGLAVCLAHRGQPDEAVRHLREAVRLAPALEEAHYNLGVLLAAEDRPREAIASLRRALELRGDWPAAEADLAWLFSTSLDPSLREAKAAVSLAQHAVASTGGRDARALDVLAASLASDGQFGEAVRATEQALKIAEAARDQNGADAIRHRLELYRHGVAYVEHR